MGITILEILRNADYNLKSNLDFQIQLGKEQLHNAVVLLEKGYSLYDDIESLLEKHGDVEKVPEKET